MQIREIACLYPSANLGWEMAANYLLQPFRAFRKDRRDKLNSYAWKNILQRELFSFIRQASLITEVTLSHGT